jgi:hypothetical protein
MSTVYSGAAPAKAAAPFQTDGVGQGEKPFNTRGMFGLLQSWRALILVSVWLISPSDEEAPAGFRSQTVSTVQIGGLEQALGSEAAINETTETPQSPIKDEECLEEGRVLATRFSAAPQADLRVDVQLDGLENKLKEQAAVLYSLNARFEDHKRIMIERLQELEDLLKKSLAVQLEGNST